MSTATETDVVVCGGGIAGIATAAALAGVGLRVTIVDAGQHAERRLAGELLHPAGVAGLQRLGLLASVERRDPTPIHGFAVHGSATAPLTLDYPADEPAGASYGLALEHNQIRSALSEGIAARAGVALRAGSRVIGAVSDEAGIAIAVKDRSGAIDLTRARLLVAADGSFSRVRALAGIGAQHRRVSMIRSFVVPAEAIAQPGYGHVFFGRLGPILAYGIDKGRARILFDHPASTAADPVDCCRADLDRLPSSLADALQGVIGKQRPLGFATHIIKVDGVSRGRVVLVGDAAGTCHPLTASGMTACIADALSLRDAIVDCSGDFDRALVRHAARRRVPQRTRMSLAAAVHEVYCGTAPELELLRHGMLRYWSRDARNRARSMALMATDQGRPARLGAAMATVALHGLADWIMVHRQEDRLRIHELAAVMAGTGRVLARYVAGLAAMPPLVRRIVAAP